MKNFLLPVQSVSPDRQHGRALCEYYQLDFLTILEYGNKTLATCLEEQWQTLLTAQNQQDLLRHLVKTAELLGFDYCAFGFRAPYPLAAPKTLLLNNYPIIIS